MKQQQKKMKKYFMKGTAEEVKIGDMLVLDLTEDLPNGKVRHHHMECKFIPQIIPLLLEQGVIEENEVKEKKEKSSKLEDNLYILLQKIIHINELLNQRMDALEELVAKLSLSLAYRPTPSANSPKPRRNAKKAGRK